jgi:hypothetical protein
LKEKVIALVPFYSVGCALFKAAFQTIHEQEQMTQYRLETSSTKYFPIMPVEVILNPHESSFEWIHDDDLGNFIDQVFQTVYVIPFLDSLRQFCHVWDGHYLKNHPFYIENRDHILRI